MTRKSKMRLAQDKKQESRAREEGKQMKSFLPVIGGAAVGGALYVLHAPSFLILLGAAGTALITGAKIWGGR